MYLRKLREGGVHPGISEFVDPMWKAIFTVLVLLESALLKRLRIGTRKKGRG
jgi:hypothetical protein